MKRLSYVFVSSVLALTPASAAETGQKPLGEILSGPALQSYERGRELFEAGDVVTGHAKLLEAYELSKNSRLLWNMAACSKSARHYARAITELTRFLEDGRGEITTEQSKRAEDVRATLYSLVAAVTLTSHPKDATFTIDSNPLGVITEGVVHYLDIGPHQVRIEHEGFRTDERTVEVKQAKPFALEVSLAPIVPLALSAASPGVPVAPEAPPERSERRTWAYASLAVGALGVGAGTGFGLMAVSSKQGLDAQCTGGVCPTTAQGDINTARAWAAASTTGWIVGGLSLGLGAYLFFSESPASKSASGLRLSPVVGPQGAYVTGSF